MIRLSFTRSGRKKNSDPLKSPKFKQRLKDRWQKTSNKLAVVNVGSSFLSKNEIMLKTQNINSKPLNKTQENIKPTEFKTLNYSGKSTVLSIEDLLLLEKELFYEPIHPKHFSQSPIIVSLKKDYLIELKGRKTGTIKDSKSRPSSKQNIKNTTKYVPFRGLRPLKPTNKLKKKRNDTPSPWSFTNY